MPMLCRCVSVLYGWEYKGREGLTKVCRDQVEPIWDHTVIKDSGKNNSSTTYVPVVAGP